jgi:P-type conjugative transfer protein TrbJ
MKRLLCALTFVVLFASLAAPAWSFPVTCTNCSTSWTQVMEQITNLEQLANAVKTYQEAIEQTRQQIQILQTTIQQYENMLKNTANLPQNMLGEMRGTFGQLAQLTNSLNLQKGDYMALGEVFDEIYPGLDIIKGLAGGDGDMTVDEVWQKWSEEVDRAALSTFQVTGNQLRDIAENSENLDDQISRLLSTPEGQMQALQSGNSLAALQINELRQLRMLMATNIQMTTQMAMKDEKRGQLSKEQIDHIMDTSGAAAQYKGYF